MHDDDTTNTSSDEAPKVFVDPRLVLLKRAIDAAGCAEALADLFDVDRRTVERWKKRAQYLTPDKQRALAVVAGDRPIEEAGDGQFATRLKVGLRARAAADAAVAADAAAIDLVFEATRNVAVVVDRFPEHDPAALRRYITDRFGGAARRGRRRDKVWSDLEVRAAIVAAADETGLVTGTRYDEYRARVQAEGGDAPSRMTIMVRFDGSWAAAVESAGCQTGMARRATYARRWDDASIRRVVRQFVEAQPAGARNLRWVRFDEWLQANPSADLPCAATVRHRVGDWPSYVDGVAAEVDRPQAA